MLSQVQVVKVRKALEKGYIGRMDVYEYTQTTDPTTHITSATETKVHNQIPCRMSHNSEAITTGEDVGKLVQNVILYFAPEIVVSAGSKIVVTQNGVTQTFRHSGTEAIYDTHREVGLELFDRWA